MQKFIIVRDISGRRWTLIVECRKPPRTRARSFSRGAPRLTCHDAGVLLIASELANAVDRMCIASGSERTHTKRAERTIVLLIASAGGFRWATSGGLCACRAMRLAEARGELLTPRRPTPPVYRGVPLFRNEDWWQCLQAGAMRRTGLPLETPYLYARETRNHR